MEEITIVIVDFGEGHYVHDNGNWRQTQELRNPSTPSISVSGFNTCIFIKEGQFYTNLDPKTNYMMKIYGFNQF